MTLCITHIGAPVFKKGDRIIANGVLKECIAVYPCSGKNETPNGSLESEEMTDYTFVKVR